MINLVVALAAESRPLIDHFRLREDRSVTGFRVYRNGDIRLIVTGMGRVACAAGTAVVGEARDDAAAAAWLNIGIAGHASHPVGEGVHALNIIDAASGRRWYPVQIVSLAGCGETVCTVDAPETGYREPHVYDMEASAFYATALRYATGELIQVYKIISDNRARGVETVDRGGIRRAVSEHIPAIEAMVEGLSGLAAEAAASQPRLPEIDHILRRWHFTVAQQHRLRELMRRWEILHHGEPVLDAELNRCPSAKAFLGELSDRLAVVYRRGEGRN
ncbi:MAG TPA: hypothetical protein VK973_08910 [Arenicellales bacterium]|nr:hypothetical protein [Arenicellales bacterium]